MLAVLVLRNLGNRALSVLLLRDEFIIIVFFHSHSLEIAGFWLQKLVIGYVVFGLGQLLGVGGKVLLLVLHELEVLEWHLLRGGYFWLCHYFRFRLDVLLLRFPLLD